MPDDDLLLESASSEAQENGQNQIDSGEELEPVRARVLELEGLVAQRDEEVAQANARVSELEQAVDGLDSKLAEAVSSYRSLAVETNPTVLEELITGDTVEDINASLEKAKTLVSRVKEGLEAEIASARVPAGAPERAPINLEALSPREKIEYAIGGRR